MRGFVVALAVLFLTGAQARYPWQHEEPQGPLHHYREVIENDPSKVQDIDREAVSQAESSDVGKQLDLKIAETFDTLSTNALALKKQLHPYVEKVREQVAAELSKDIPLLREKNSPFVENFPKNWAGQVKAFHKKGPPLGAELKKQIKNNLEAFEEKMQAMVKDFREKMRAEFDYLSTNLVSYSSELMQETAENDVK